MYYIRKNYKNFKTKHWRSIFFQLLSVLAIVQSKYPSFRHNDLKMNNLLVNEIAISPKDNKYFYKINNKYYDIHYFFNTFETKGFFPEFWTDECIPLKVKEFVNRIIPDKYKTGDNVSPRGRLLVDDEYLLPDEILKNDVFFKIWRV